MQTEWYRNPDTGEPEQIDFFTYRFRIEIPYANPDDDVHGYFDNPFDAYSKASDYAQRYKRGIDIEVFDPDTETWKVTQDDAELFGE